MKKSMKRIAILIALICFIIYSVSILFNQYLKLNSYAKQKEFYEDKLKEAQSRHEELLVMQENVDSPEYIEMIAREKLDMYYPNERVYIDMSK